MTTTNDAMRKRVSRIEKRMANGGNPTQDELRLVQAWRKTHRKYKGGLPAPATSELQGRPLARPQRLQLTDAERAAMAEAEEAERLAQEGEGVPNGQTDGMDTVVAPQTDTPVAAVGQVEMDTPMSLGSFASEVMDIPTSKAGVCPVEGCGAPIRDTDMRCGRCGAIVRPDLCPKCRTPFAADDKFCRVDATPRPVVAAAKVVTDSTGQPQLEKPVIRMWTKANTSWLMMAIDLGLKRGGMDPLDDEEKKQLVDALVPVLNKRLPATGAWAEEIRLAVVAVGVFAPRFYIAMVIVPQRREEERRKNELHAAQLQAVKASVSTGPTPAPTESPSLVVPLPSKGGK